MRRIACCVLVSALAAAAPARGDAAPPTTAPDDDGDDLDDTVASGDTPLTDLTLEELMQLDVVEVSELRPVPRRLATADVTVLTRADIEMLGARTLADLLRAVPGVDVSLDNDGTVRPSVRGLDQGADILLMVDGLRVNDAVSGAAYYDLPAAFIERVEVLRGPASAIYGSNAILGVISVTTRVTDHALIGGRIGSFASGEAFVVTSAKHAGWKLRTGLDIAQTRGPDFTLARDQLTSSQPDVSEAPGRIAGRDERLLASFFAERGSFQLGGFALEDERGPYVGTLGALTREGDRKSRFLGLSAVFDQAITPSVRVLARAAATTWRFDDERVVKPPGWRSTGLVTDLDGDGLPEVFPDGLIERERLANRELTADARVTWTTCRGDVTAGVLASYTAVTGATFETNATGNPTLYRPDFADYAGRTFPRVDRLVLAPYAQWEDELTSWAYATAGARLDVVSDGGGATSIDTRVSVSPRAAIVLTPDPRTEIRLLYGRAFRAPTLRELHDPAGRELGNPDLRSETSQTGELRVTRHLDALELHAAAFVGELDDRIDVPLTTSLDGQNPYLNHAGTRIAGAELEARGRWDRYALLGDVSYTHATDLEHDVTLERIAPWSADLAGEARLGDYATLGAVGHLRGPREPPQLTFFQRERLRGTRQPTTLMLDLVARTRNLPGRWWATAALYNVLGTDYREVPRDAFFLLDDPGGSNALPAQPRMVMLEVGRSF